MTRAFPYFSKRPSVARNTPPMMPTSSPNTSTRSSRCISSARAWLTASTTVRSAIELPVEAPELKRQARRWFSVDLREVKARVGSRLLLRLVPRHAQLFLYFLLDAVEGRPVDNAARHEMQLHPTQRVAVDPCVVHLARFVARRIVRGGVQAQAIRECLDERRALAVTGPADGVANRRIDGEEVVAVALDAGKPVGDRLLRQSSGGGLLLDRGRDRPAVVLAQKDDRGLHHPREVGRLVEVALRGAAVTENREHDAGVVLHPQPPRETDRLGQLARDRGLKGKHVQALGNLERDRVADVPQEGEPK